MINDLIQSITGAIDKNIVFNFVKSSQNPKTKLNSMLAFLLRNIVDLYSTCIMNK